MKSQDIYQGDELDTEWSKYMASLHESKTVISKKYRDKKRIIDRERETMINLQKHVRGLSRARFELADAAIDSFDDTSSSDNESDTGTVNIISTPLSEKMQQISDDTNNYSSDDNNSNSSDCHSSDSDFIAPTPNGPNIIAPTMNKLINKPLNYNNYKSKTILPPIMVESNDNDPYNIKSETNDNFSNYDSNDSDINDSHCINDSNDSNDSFSDSNSNSFNSPKSVKSNSKSSSIESNESIQQIENDKELIKLKKELNHYKRKNVRLRRTKSQEAVLLSVLKIDEKDIDRAQLTKCTKKAITKYNTMTLREKRRVEKEKAKEKSKKLKLKLKYNKYKNKFNKQSIEPIRKIKMKNKSDSYELHNNIDSFVGFDPNNYEWYDDMAEGTCLDDNELSLYLRRMQYLVVVAVENHYCSINDLTYQQNELLLLYQKTIKF